MGQDPAPSDSVLDALPAGVLSVDASGHVRYANRTIATMIGWETNDLVGAHVDRILPPAGRIFYSTHLFPLLRIQAVAEELYVPLLGADGAEIPVMVSGARRETEEGQRFDLVLMPMRQRNALETELISARNSAQEAAAAKDRFLSIVSHELRSPLSAITGYAELLLRERVGTLTEDQRRYVERIRDSGQYQAGLISDILDFAAIGERREMTTMAIAVEEVLSRAEAILALRAEEEGRRFERSPRPAPGAVRADGRATQQILLNLGMNAIKYGRPDSTVTVTSEIVANRVRIGVVDEGAGIGPDDLERIFQPFMQLPSDVGGSRRGVGLGLAISRDLARAMRGDVTVASTPGAGSTFTLELPAA